MVKLIKKISRNTKILILVFFDQICFLIAFLTTTNLFSTPLKLLSTDYLYLTLTVQIITLLLFFRFYRSSTQSLNFIALIKFNLFIILGLIIWYSIFNFENLVFNFNEFFFFFILLANLVTGFRVIAREILKYLKNMNAQYVLIYGTDNNALAFANLLFNSGVYKPIGFVENSMPSDSDRLMGLPIIKLDKIFDSKKFDDAEILFIDRQNSTQEERLMIFTNLVNTKMVIRNIPHIGEPLEKSYSENNFDDLDIENFLNRDSIVFNSQEINNFIKDKVILVSGAGGSIGSELCMQIARNNPKQIILVDNSEFNLFQIEDKLNDLSLEITIEPYLRDINEDMSDIFELFRPNLVLHAAALKHVPLAEKNICKVTKTNIFGTLNIANTAQKFNVEKFVLISTDKAVRPTNIMGATKHVAELLCLNMQNDNKNSKTIFSAVRFGNVLASSGSVIPTFVKQIERGGPVTVTHPEITRFFMTRTEAVSLVLETLRISENGKVYLLEMGKPVKISDLAKMVIRQKGFKPFINFKNSYKPISKNSINIVYTGLRPGEKLHEELLINPKNVTKLTDKIFSSTETLISKKEILLYTKKIQNALDKNNEKDIESILINMPISFNRIKNDGYLLN